MRHNVDGRKFGRNTSHRLAMFRNMANSVIVSEQIVTTVQKAKEARRVVDRLITLAKAGDLHSKRLVFDRTRSRQVVEKLFSTLADRYRDRAGGYTRVVKISDRRRGDAAEMAVLELVDHPPIDRRRKLKDEGAEPGKKEASGDAPAVQDPFKKFRGLFKGRKQGASAVGSEEKAPKAPRAPKAPKSAARKASSRASSGSSK